MSEILHLEFSIQGEKNFGNLLISLGWKNYEEDFIIKLLQDA